jgi:hypothetical protein
MEKLIIKFIYKHKRLKIDKAILSKNSNVNSLTASYFKLYYRTIVTKAAWYWHKKTEMATNGID